jgi:hypothetical protein
VLDLDALESRDGSFDLYCHFGCLLLSNRITYIQWDKLVRGFNIHQYILPDYRRALEELLDLGWQANKKTSAMLLQYALRMKDIETHYSETHQLRMTEIMYLHLRQSRVDSSMEKLPENCGTLTPEHLDF